MRKLDYLRKLAKKTRFEDEIYHWNVDAFANSGDCTVSAIPLSALNGELLGVVIEHTYVEDDFTPDMHFATYDEVFEFKFPSRVITPVQTGYCTVSRPTKKFLKNISAMTQDEVWNLTWDDVMALS